MAKVCYTGQYGRSALRGYGRMVISYQRLWRLLESRKMTKKELARRAGISESTVRVMTRGGNVSLDVLGKICAAMRVDIGDIAQFVEV